MKNIFERQMSIVGMRWAVCLAALMFATAPACLAQLYRVGPQPGQSSAQSPAGGVPGAQGAPSQAPAQAVAPAPLDLARGGDLILGPGDIIQIQVTDDPDISGKYMVSQSGDIRIPTVPAPINAMNLDTTQVSDKIAQALVRAKILKDPVVSIFVEEYHSHTVTVLGAVQRPGVYPVEVNTTVLQAISEAGGLLPTAGSAVTVTRERPQDKNSGTAHVQTVSETSDDVTVSVADMVAGKQGSANVLVHAGDLVNVGTAPIVYVVGAVTRPGAFAIQSNNSQVSVLQALALVEGLTSVAAPKRAIIVRNSTDLKNRKEIPVNITSMLAGKETDQYLLANDILFVPESGLKKSLHRMGDVAVGAATEVAGYGSALRVAAF